VPCVSTDVGSCRQLVEGLGAIDKSIGASGMIVGIANPTELAQAIISLLGNPERWRAAQTAGITRVERYYTQEQMFGRYRSVYQNAMTYIK
jgi:glycosyltransferase involved in cell wall biosynthesis